MAAAPAMDSLTATEASPRTGAVELELLKQVESLTGPMLEVCRYATHGGRRARAALLLAAAGEATRPAVLAATAVEMMHAATLLQDDIFDAGCMRRGRATAHVRFGRAMTILASDWLLIRSLELAVEVDTSFFRCLARAGTAMAQAEAQELQPPLFVSMAEAKRFGCEVARGKTAALFACVLHGAAAVQGIGGERAHSWEQMGVEMGVTYQMVDDYLDVYGTQRLVQKDVGRDLVAGRLTMPVLLAMGALAERGVVPDLEALQRDALTEAERVSLGEALQSAPVQDAVRTLLRGRLARHCDEAEREGVATEAVQAWAADLAFALEGCFCELKQERVEAVSGGAETSHQRVPLPFLPATPGLEKRS